MTTKRLNSEGKLVPITKFVTATEKAAKDELGKAKPFLSDTAKRALHAFWQALLPSVGILLTTPLSDQKDVALSAVTAAGASALSLIKSAILNKINADTTTTAQAGEQN